METPRALLAAAALAGCLASPVGAAEPTSVVFADHRAKARLRFAVLGDTGSGDAAQHRVGAELASVCEKGGGCDFVLMAGDNLYGSRIRAAPAPDGSGRRIDRRFIERFEIPYEALGRVDFWLVAGNHDWSSRESVEREIAYSRYSSRWRMPALDYAVPKLPGWIRIYGIDTHKIDKGRGDDQIPRARAALCGGDGWKLLLGHHPAYSSGKHANPYGSLPKIVEGVVGPLIEECGIHLYFAGHEHHQEHLQAARFDQIVQGAGGKLRRMRSIRARPAGVRQLAGASRYGFAIVEVTAKRLELRFFGYAAGDRFESFHCRSYERASFGDAARRSRPCDD